MTLKIDAKIRTLIGKKVEKVRDEGKIPAVLYGHGVENKNLELDYNDFNAILKEAGESTIIDLNVDGESVKVLISDVQKESVSDRYRHIDFHQIRMDEKVTTHVELKFVGEAPAVKDLDGVLVHNISEVEIRCLPADLISEIEVDVSGLETFDDTVTIADLKVSDKTEITKHASNDVVATVTEPSIEEEPEVVVAESAEGEENKEEDKTAEGEEKK